VKGVSARIECILDCGSYHTTDAMCDPASVLLELAKPWDAVVHQTLAWAKDVNTVLFHSDCVREFKLGTAKRPV